MVTNINGREKLIAISIRGGLIQLIEPDGKIGVYRQRGIQTLGAAQLVHEIASGNLRNDWMKFTELPKNYSIRFEDTEVMGRALATYPLVLANRRNSNKNKEHIGRLTKRRN